MSKISAAYQRRLPKKEQNQNTWNDGLKTLERVKLQTSWNYKIAVDCRRDVKIKNRGPLNFPTTFLYYNKRARKFFLRNCNTLVKQCSCFWLTFFWHKAIFDKNKGCFQYHDCLGNCLHNDSILTIFWYLGGT